MRIRRIGIIGVVVGAVVVCLTGCILQNKAPVADFIASPLLGIAPLTVQFNASSSSDVDGLLVSYDWDFDDDDSYGSKTICGVQTSHTFWEPGTYVVRLTVTDDHGNVGTTYRKIAVAEGAYEDSSALRILDWTLAYGESELFPWYVIGRAQNVTDCTLAYAGVSADFYDSRNLLLGNGIDIVFDLPPGGTWEFRIPLADTDVLEAVDHAAVFVSAASHE